MPRRPVDDWEDDLPPVAPRRRHAPAGVLPLRLAQAAAANPLTAGGLFVGLLTAALIVSNALTNQPGRHPAPLFETRPFATPAALVPAVQPQPRPEAAAREALVRDVQTALKDRGFYRGPIDGLAGPMTSDAIRAFERAVGQPETGEPSERLLAAAYSQPLAPARQPTAAAAPRVETVAAQPLVTAPARPAVTATPAAQPAVVRPAPAPAPARVQDAHPRLADVQRALDKLGYGPVRITGQPTRETEEAIKRFELDRGLKLSGDVTDRLLFELIAAGVLR